MQIRDLQAGKTLDILVDREEFHYHFVSKIEGVSGNSVAVSAISASGRRFRFVETDDISLIYRLTERMWRFDHVKGGVARMDGETVHTFTTSLEAKIYNRRDFFRVPFGEDFRMRRVITELSEENEEIKREIGFSAYLFDLSAGGAGIYTNQRLEIGDEVLFDLPTNTGLISCRGTIIREADVGDRPFQHFYGVNFYQVKAGLNKFLFERQRLRLQRERGGRSL